MSWKRITAIIFAIVAVVFAIVSLAAVSWVVDKNISDRNTKISLGLNKWKYHWDDSRGNTLSSSEMNYDDAAYYTLFGPGGLGAFLGKASTWKSAGNAVLALGGIAIILSGLAIIASIATWKRFIQNWKLTALPAWIAGFCFILGAILYEGIRPAFHGNVGYEWPYGLFITSGVFIDVSAIFWYWDFATPNKPDTQRRI